MKYETKQEIKENLQFLATVTAIAMGVLVVLALLFLLVLAIA